MKNIKDFLLFGSSTEDNRSSYALLFLRVAAGVLMMLHGWGKLSNFEAMSGGFPDPLGVGITLSLILAIGAEFFASIFLMMGLLTRLSLIPLIFTMGVAFFVIHAADPLQTKELALLYMVVFIFFFIAGAGKFSLDRLLFGKYLKNRD